MRNKANEFEFELETFRQVNEHMRATDRKYWVTSGAYISLFLLFLTQLTESDIVSETPDSAEMFHVITTIASHLFIGVFGMIVYLMQTWYRSWKEHYLDVLHELRGRLYPSQNNNKYLPFWLQQKANSQIISVDNSLKLLTLLLNAGFTILVCFEISHLLPSILRASLIIMGLILYIAILFTIYTAINKNNHLNA